MLDERIYLTYQPSFDIRRALAFRVEKAGEKAEEIKLPTELEDAASILTSDLLAMADALLDRIDEALEELRGCLGKKEFAGLTVDDYDRAVTEGDTVRADAFEDFHIADISGSTQGELYCLFKSLRGRVEELRGFVEQIAPVKPVPPARLAEAEEKLYTDMAYLEHTRPGSVDRLALAYEAQLKHQVRQRLEYLSASVEEGISAAQMTPQDSCNGSAERVGGDMAAGGAEVLRGLKKVLGVAFANMAETGLQLKEHGRLYGNDEMMKQLREAAVSLAELRLGAARQVTAWLKSLELADETSPAYTLAHCALDGLAAIDSGLDTTILDLSKAQQTERMNLEERLKNIVRRKQVRQLIGLADAVLSTVNFDAPPEERRKQGEAAALAFVSKSKGMCAY